MNKKILILVTVVVILGVGFYAYDKHEAQAPAAAPAAGSGAQQQPVPASAANTAAQTPAAATSSQGGSGAGYVPGQFSSGGEGAGSDVQVYEVDYDGTAFSPSSVNIAVNDYIFFKNKSNASFWPQSDSAGGFDAGKAVAPGGEFKYQFTEAGTVAYHDHNNTAATGTVIVAK